MMKNKFLFLMMFGFLFFASCSDDDDTTWKKIPQEEILSQNITLEINGESASTGTVQMTVKNESEAVLNLKNVIPGYAEVPVSVALEKLDDNSFAFAGEQGLTNPPSMLVRSTAEPIILYVQVNGKVTLDGKASVTAKTRLSETAQAGLTGSWSLLATASLDESGGVTAAPLLITWSAIDANKPNMEAATHLVNVLGSAVLFNVLNQVTLHEDGNITAKYWPEISIEDILNDGMDDEGNFIATHEKWLDSPKSLAYWYAKSNMIYIVPNIDAIMKQVNKDNESEEVGNMEDLTSILAMLGEYNIDIDALLPTVMQWVTTGIPLKYGVDDNALKIYVDKEMATPFITAILPALDKLQVDVDKIIADGGDNAFLIKMVLGILGIEKLTDIKTIWEENTKDFELSLNFVNGK